VANNTLLRIKNLLALREGIMSFELKYGKGALEITDDILVGVWRNRVVVEVSEGFVSAIIRERAINVNQRSGLRVCRNVEPCDTPAALKAGLASFGWETLREEDRIVFFHPVKGSSMPLVVEREDNCLIFSFQGEPPKLIDEIVAFKSRLLRD